MAIFESAIFWIVVAAASEIIALTPLRSNSVIQLVIQALNSIKPAKKDWYLKTVAGFFNMTLVVMLKEFSGLFRIESSMQPYLTN